MAGVATYTGGADTGTLIFDYFTKADENTADLKVTSITAAAGSIKDGDGDAASLTAAANADLHLAVDTIAPAITKVTALPASGTFHAGQTIGFTVTASEAVIVDTSGGAPVLELNDGGVATYVYGSGSNLLQFSYTVGAGDNTSALKVTDVRPVRQHDQGSGRQRRRPHQGCGDVFGHPCRYPTSKRDKRDGGARERRSGGSIPRWRSPLHMSEITTVSGGMPTLTLSDGRARDLCLRLRNQCTEVQLHGAEHRYQLLRARDHSL